MRNYPGRPVNLWAGVGAATNPDLWVVVLRAARGGACGILSRRSWSSDRPQQFCRIIGTRSMLRHTWDRACGWCLTHAL